MTRSTTRALEFEIGNNFWVLRKGTNPIKRHPAQVVKEPFFWQCYSWRVLIRYWWHWLWWLAYCCFCNNNHLTSNIYLATLLTANKNHSGMGILTNYSLQTFSPEWAQYEVFVANGMIHFTKKTVLKLIMNRILWKLLWVDYLCWLSLATTSI